MGEYDGEQRVLNQNDARPSDLAAFASSARSTRYMLQFSGAIWYPMVYELPDAGQAGARQAEAGAAVRPDPALHRRPRRPVTCSRPPGRRASSTTSCGGFNDIFGDEGNIFPDQTVFLDWLAAKGHDEGRLLLPGSVADVDAPGCPVTHPYDPARDVRIFADKDAPTCSDMQARRMPGVEAVQGHLGAPGDRRPRRR